MISIAMGGYIAEQMIFGKENVTSGASSDFQSANSIAKEMVTKYAMGDDNSFLVAPVVTLSEEAVNRNIEKILQRNYEVAKAILEKNKDKLIKLADTLLKEEILTYEQLEVLLGLPKKQDAQ
jgi:ATP-dependent metalloprotease